VHRVFLLDVVVLWDFLHELTEFCGIQIVGLAFLEFGGCVGFEKVLEVFGDAGHELGDMFVFVLGVDLVGFVEVQEFGWGVAVAVRGFEVFDVFEVGQ
jgi:hypothetical protein